MHQAEADQSETEQIETSEAIKGILLSKVGAKKVAEKFEEKIESVIFYPPENQRMSYQKIIANQVHRFRRVLQNEEAEYKPFIIR